MEQVLAFRSNGSWRSLESKAQYLIANAQSVARSSFNPTLGGGTRLMLALNHRISHDIDLFMDTPAWIGYVTPRLVDDVFVNELQSYDEQSSHVRWVFSEGEIDFIVGLQLLNWDGLWNPSAKETSLTLDPPLEVIAKKLFYRGWSLTPRDLFDWYCFVNYGEYTEQDHHQLAHLLKDKYEDLLNSIELLGKRNLTFKQRWASILSPFEVPQEQAVDWAIDQLNSLSEIAFRKPKSNNFSNTP